MNKIVKSVTSFMVSAVMAVTCIATLLKQPQIANVSAYSYGQQLVNRAYQNRLGNRPNAAHYYFYQYTQMPGTLQADWCAMYISYLAYLCGLQDYIPMMSYVDNQSGYSNFRTYYESKGQFMYPTWGFPSVGDLVIFDYGVLGNEAWGMGDHIGIVTSVDTARGFIGTIEGNSSGDKVSEHTYHYTDGEILGYCQPFKYVESSNQAQNPQPAPSVPAGPSAPSYNTNEKINKWELTSSIGGWLRAEAYYGRQIGIISTGTILNSDYTKNKGEWIFVKSAVLENGAVFDGYIHRSIVSPVSESSASPAPVTTAPAAETTTTTTTTVTTTITAASTSAPSESSTGVSTTVTSAETTVVTTIVTEPVAPEQPVEPNYAPTHYVSCLIGANGRSSAMIAEDNILTIVDTDSKLYVSHFEGEFAYCLVESTGQWLYLHNTTIAALPPNGEYTYGARVTHFVSSPEGLNLRAKGDYSGDVLCILDTYQEISVLTAPNELGFVFCEFTFGDGIVHNGYVHIDHITAY